MIGIIGFVFRWADVVQVVVHQALDLLEPVAYFTREVNPGLAKPPLKFNGSLAKFWLTSVIK